MKKTWAFFGMIGLLSIGLVGCGSSEENKEAVHHSSESSSTIKEKEDKIEENLDVTQYVKTPSILEKVFHKTYKEYQLSKIKVDIENTMPIYEIQGINHHKEATLKVEAKNVNKIISKQEETIDQYEQDTDDQPLIMKDVKKTPTEAIKIAQQETKLKASPNEWGLESKDGKAIYIVNFEKEHKEVEINAKDGVILNTEIDE